MPGNFRRCDVDEFSPFLGGGWVKELLSISLFYSFKNINCVIHKFLICEIVQFDIHKIKKYASQVELLV